MKAFLQKKRESSRTIYVSWKDVAYRLSDVVFVHKGDNV